jgi:DNA polymerase III delta prime subunit
MVGNTSVAHVLWVEKYRPHRVADCILPQSIKVTFEEIVKQGIVPNMILAGKAGGGKTTAALAICDELDLDWLLINASENGNIDTLRTEIREFASTRSFDGARRVVVLDEADHLNPNSTQPALRSFIEEFASNVSFIFTCNNLAKIITPLHSRASIIEYAYAADETPALVGQFYKRLKMILDTEKIGYDLETIKKTLGMLILKFWPDMRRTINELQRYSLTGTIDDGILEQVQDAPLQELIEAVKKDDFKKMRAWCAVHADADSIKVIRKVYDSLYDLFEPDSIPGIVLLCGEYQYKAAFAQDQEMHLCAFLTEVMMQSEVKK